MAGCGTRTVKVELNILHYYHFLNRRVAENSLTHQLRRGSSGTRMWHSTMPARTGSLSVLLVRDPSPKQADYFFHVSGNLADTFLVVILAFHFLWSVDDSDAVAHHS